MGKAIINAGKRSGSVGGETYAGWKDKTVVKAKSSGGNQPNSNPQKAQKSRFTMSVALGRLFLATLIRGMKGYSSKMTEMNAFIKLNKDKFTGAFPNQAIDFINLIVSKGSLLIVNMSNTHQGGVTGSINFDLTSNSNGTTGLDTDKLRIAYCSDDGSVAGDVATAYTRATTQAILNLVIDANLGGTACFIYPYFTDAAGVKVSDNTAFAVNLG